MLFQSFLNGQFGDIKNMNIIGQLTTTNNYQNVNFSSPHWTH